MIRRRTGASEGDQDHDYETALGQGASEGRAHATPSVIHRGEASPGMLEAGALGNAGELPTAHPFYSEKAREEIALMRQRPSTLDEDQARVNAEMGFSEVAADKEWFPSTGEEVGDPKEPDYGKAFMGASGPGSSAMSAPRVARIEPTTGSSPGLGERRGLAVDPTEPAQKSGREDAVGLDLKTTQGSGPNSQDMAAATEGGGEDYPELIPAEPDRLARMELLLGQVIEENKNLKRQLQSESHSSWHSARTPQEVLWGDCQQVSMDQAQPWGSNTLLWEPGRLAIDPASVVASYDVVKYQRIESRAVSLLLAAVPAGLKEDIVVNRQGISDLSVLWFRKSIGKPCLIQGSQAQAKGIVEDPGSGGGGSEGNLPVSSSASAVASQENLIAEAAKLLKNVTLKVLKVVDTGRGDEDLKVDGAWLLSAISGPSDAGFALVDSGATNALRPAELWELEQGRSINVDLASGVAELRINSCGISRLAGEKGSLRDRVVAELRVMLVFAVAQAAMEAKSQVFSALCADELQQGVVDSTDFHEPQDLATWALRKAAAKLAGSSGEATESLLPGNGASVFLVYERKGGQDPGEWADLAHKEIEIFQKLYHLSNLEFDQGPFIDGVSYSEEASGRDKGGGYKYMLVGTYAVPANFSDTRAKDSPEGGIGSVLEGELSDDDQPELVAQEGPKDDSALLDELWNLPEPSQAELKAVTHRVRGKHPEAEDVPREPERESSVKHYTLFMGVPVRSKHAKEILPNVQAMINRLEASGFPVQRYHCDRAQELKSAALLSWLKHQGIYTTFTAGECPAGNREDCGLKGKRAVDRFIGCCQMEEPEVGRYTMSIRNQPCLMGDFGKATAEHREELRELGFPVDKVWGDGADVCAEPGLEETAEQLRSTEVLCEWLEGCLDEWTLNSEVSLRALQVEVPLAGESVPDRFLQTRTVGLVEARSELGLWKEPALEEVTSLETTNQAVDRVKAALVDQWIEQGYTVIQLPGKAVLTRKSGTGKRRFRAVCCGNYLPPEKLGLSKDDVYASGVEAVTLRVALCFASIYSTWTGITIDIKSAFLYAPIGTRSKDQEERIIVKPPALLVELGVLEASDRWHVRKALYGLPTSPRDWGDYRDKEFRALTISCEGVAYGLFQSKSDESLWLVQPVGEQGKGPIAGLLVVYVDDLAFFAAANLCQCFIDQVQKKWKTSPPSWFGEEPVTFCGAEVTRSARGYRLTQVSYLKELLNRYNIEGTAASPITKWTEPPEQGVPYLHKVGSYFSDHGQLALPRQNNVVEVYSDASHSPCGGRSVQCCIIVWRGSPLAWESARQGFTTLSSAEAELVSMIHSVQLGECIQPLVEELLSDDSVLSLLADNAAAIRSFEMAPAGWRNRHLRMRAQAGRERIENNVLRVNHLAGLHQAADIGTKPLARSRLLYLMDLINVRDQPASPEMMKAARVLSRSYVTGQLRGISPEAIAGLALLCMLPGARGQPMGDHSRLVSDWVYWVVATLVTVGCVLVGTWFRGFVPSEEPLETAIVVAEGAGNPDNLDDDFSPEEWASAEAKLIAAERSTGLTFVQRARLRKQLAKGDLVDPPVFQQRHGPLPYWLTGRSGSSGVWTEVPERGSGLVAFLLRFGVTLLGMIGVPQKEWGCLRMVCRRLRSLAAVTLASRVPGRLTREGGTGAGEGRSASSNVGEPSVPSPQPFGIQQEPGRSSEGPCDMSAGRDGCPSPLGTGEVLSSSSEEQSRSPSPLGASEVLSSSSEEQSRSPSPLGASEVPFRPAEEQSRSPSFRRVERDLVQGSSLQEGPVAGTDVQVGGSASSQDQFEVPRPRVQVGGSSGSQGPAPTPNVQHGGSSGSHGMTVAPSDELCYEDYCGDGMLTDQFPYVGSWLVTHYLVQLLSQTGETILWTVGERAGEWRSLRCASAGLRYALVFAVVEVLRRGPQSLLYNGPQWVMATEEFILTEPPLIMSSTSRRRPAGPIGLVARGVVFPYVEGPPGMIAHFLWRLLMEEGWLLLELLGDRTGAWRALRAVAPGFRAGATLALTVWLRKTRHFYMASAQATYDAADAYMQGRELQYPFVARAPEEAEQLSSGHEDDESVDDRPLRPRTEDPGRVRWGPVGQAVLEDSSSESEGSGSSTTEPSVVGVSADSSSEQSEECQPVEEGTPLEGSRVGGLPRTSYQAAEGKLLVFYGDDELEVPLPGWSQSAVQGIVTGLDVGDWSGLEAAVQGLGEAVPSVDVDAPAEPDQLEAAEPAPGQGWIGSWLRVVVTLCLISWIVLRGIQGVGATKVEECAVDLLEPRDSQAQARSDARDDVALSCGSSACDGSSLWTLFVSAASVGIWELSKSLAFKCFKRAHQRADAGTQTSELNVVPMPLAEGIPSRARILYSFWRAGYVIQAEHYSERIQREFETLVGGWLCRNEEGLVSPQSSSDGVLSESSSGDQGRLE
ncbi:RE1 [Symbiodinium sp. CCMP2592]|nr:RE1 [Symbiodinium sp. CCMP2592]